VSGRGPESLRALAVSLAALGPQQGPPPTPGPIANVPAAIDFASEEYVDPNGVRRRDEAELRFDEKATRVAFVGWRAGRPVGFADGVEIAGFDYLSAAPVPLPGQPIRFRAGNRAGKKSEKWWVLVGGKKSPTEDWIGAVAVSRDGASSAWWTQPGAKLDDAGAYARGPMQFVFDGKRGEKWDDADALTEPVFTRDGGKVATSAMKGRDWRVLVATKEGQRALEEEFASIGDLAWRFDGRELAFAAMPMQDGGARSWIVVGEKKGAKRLGSQCDGCGDPVWTFDGRSVAYRALGKDAKGKLRLGIGVNDLLWVKPFASVMGTPALRYDGEHTVVAARIGDEPADEESLRRGAELDAPDGKWHLVIDGHPGPEEQRVADPVFSPSGGVVACRVKRNGKWRIVVGEQESTEFDDVGPPRFTDDGKVVWFGARLGRDVKREILAVAEPAKK
jgi:hypothetical protein